ncbi:uncharacterized protein PV09_01706 [Verruconis gallopava]|uniref:Heterokaryon incompatibility domain-containing protein n=1 Tax=Verruconis gallopava TaxID=253628 RepID=A0A0D2AMQ3_9PEZI|nr:uncharacterized protein PV09_01706 [Verruconis gallopava]KIW07780.1 hypothetical protein PV09_01706 [Verruconis gallopava]
METEEILYKPLSDGNFIRYIVLEAGEDDEPLECVLVVSSLDKMPYFEAISYVWGSDRKEKDVVCNGRVVKITHNLWRVLRDVRLPRQSRTLWADSICINQEDLTEKARQVALMGQIYSKADRVLICLEAKANEHAPAAVSLLAELDEMILDKLKYASSSNGSFPFLTAEEREKLARDGRWKSLLALTEEPWFERGWVVQEAGLSTSAVVKWGGLEIEWQKVLRVWTWMEQRLPQVWTQNPTSIDRMNDLHLEIYRNRNPKEATPLYSNVNSAEVLFLDLFHYARPLRFKEPSDRVYAFLELANRITLPVSIMPDYRQHSNDVYLELARQYIESTHSVRILEYIQHTEATLLDNCPSWVPRWDVNMFEVRIVSPYGTNLDTRPMISTSNTQINTSNAKILNVCGVVVDQVEFIFEVFKEKPSITELRSLWKTISQHAQLTSPYALTDQDIAFVTTLSVGRHIGNWEQWQVYRAAYLLSLKQEGCQDEETQGKYDMIHYWVQSCTYNRRLVLTRRGYFGLGPPLTMKDDICCVLDGGMSPYILRETSMPGEYKVIGDVYITSRKRRSHLSGKGGDITLSFCEEGARDWVDWGSEERTFFLC